MMLSSSAVLTAVSDMDEYGTTEKATSAMASCGKPNARADSGSTDMA